MKQLFFFLCLMLFSCKSIFAADFIVDGLNYKINKKDSQTVSLTWKIPTELKQVVVPSTVTYNGIVYTVTRIDDRTFGSHHLEEITIPSTIKEIGINAFNCCLDLKRVNITDLAAWCNIIFDNHGATPFAQLHDVELCLNGERVEDLVIPDSVSTIQPGAFYQYKYLRSVRIPNHVKVIGAWAFNRCLNLSSVQMGDSVEVIDEAAFAYCYKLDSIYIPKSVTRMGKEVFSFNRLKSIVVDKDNPVFDSRDNCNAIIATEKNILFAGCEKTIVPNTVEALYPSSFMGCKGLKSLLLPQSVKTIGAEAFEYCDSLESLTIPHLQAIGFFGSQSSFKELNMMFTNEEDFLDYISREDISQYFYQQTLDRANHRLYIDGKLLTEVRLPSSITKIQCEAFSMCQDIIHVELSNAVASIDNLAFKGCSNLETIVIPPSIKNIGYKAFEDCGGLKGVYISDLTAWCNIDFQWDDTGCDSQANPLYFAHHLYLDGKEIKNLVIPDGLTKIKNNSFVHCAIKSVTIPNSCTVIGDGAFHHCENLEDIHWGKSVGLIKQYAFCNCTSLVSLVFPGSVHEIQNNAFQNCTNIRDLIFEDGIEKLADFAFGSTYNLENVTLGSTIKSLGYSCFWVAGRQNLKTVICYACDVPETGGDLFGIPSNGNDAQNGIDAILYVPAQSLEAYKNDFSWNSFKHILPIGTTGLERPIQNLPSHQEERVYDLNGRRLPASAKGVVIVNGKKMIRK